MGVMEISMLYADVDALRTAKSDSLSDEEKDVLDRVVRYFQQVLKEEDDLR